VVEYSAQPDGAAAGLGPAGQETNKFIPFLTILLVESCEKTGGSRHMATSQTEVKKISC